MAALDPVRLPAAAPYTMPEHVVAGQRPQQPPRARRGDSGLSVHNTTLNDLFRYAFGQWFLIFKEGKKEKQESQRGSAAFVY